MIDRNNIDVGKKMWWGSQGILDPIQVIVHSKQNHNSYTFLTVVRCDNSMAMGETKTVSIKALFENEIEAQIYSFKIMSDLMIQENIDNQHRFENIMRFINVRTNYTFEEMNSKLRELFDSFLKTDPDLLLKHLVTSE